MRQSTSDAISDATSDAISDVTSDAGMNMKPDRRRSIKALIEVNRLQSNLDYDSPFIKKRITFMFSVPA